MLVPSGTTVGCCMNFPQAYEGAASIGFITTGTSRVPAVCRISSSQDCLRRHNSSETEANTNLNYHTPCPSKLQPLLLQRNAFWYHMSKISPHLLLVLCRLCTMGDGATLCELEHKADRPSFWFSSVSLTR